MKASLVAARHPARRRAAWQFASGTSMDGRSTLLIGGAEFRLEIKQHLAASHFDVVAEAATLREAYPLLGAGMDMDLAVLESLGGFGNGVDDLRRLRLLLPSAKVVVLTIQPAADLARTAASIGIDGWLSLEMPIEALIGALRCIVAGQSLFSVNGTTLLFSHWSTDSGTASPDAEVEIPSRRRLLH
jgi:DNA-binding NarL/FixJ family response regulator